MKVLASFFCFAFVGLACANAEPRQDADLLQILLDNGTITRQQYEQLKKEAAEKQNQHVDVKVSTDGGIKLSTYEGGFAFKLGGFFAADAAFYDQKNNPLGNGTEIRFARLELEGTLFSDWDYQFSIDFANAEVDLKDAFVSYKGLESFSFNVGQFKVPFSLEQITSRKNLTFLERGLPNALVPGRKIGAGVNYYANLWTAAAGIFGDAYDEDAASEGDEGWTTSGRFTFAPVHSAKRVLHFGASTAYERPNDDRIVKIKTNPESHLTSTTFLSTGKIKNVQDQFTYGLESAIVYGPFSLQGEYVHSSLSFTNRNETPHFRGGYAYASWMITGESRNYAFRKGAFERMKPDRTYGAFEAAVRYSVLNLNNPPLVFGGRESNLTLALNWYLNRNVRVMTNYVLINNDLRANDGGSLRGNDDPGVFQARLQVAF